MRVSLRALLLTLTILVVATTVPAADTVNNNLFIGVWKYNPAKSKPFGDQDATIKLQPNGKDGFKFTRDIVEAKGNKAFWEWTANFDGKDYPFKGSPNYDAISLKHKDANTFITVNRKGGKDMSTAWYIVTKDGKTLAVTTAGVNAQGQPVVFYSVYDKQ